jgi:hypothetical protein
MLLMVLTMATAPHSTSAADSLAVNGTLVLATPSRDGLIVAADTRARLGPDVCDSHHKIVEPSRPDRTVFAVVGRSMHIEGPPPAMPDPCTHLRRAARYYDIEALTRHYLETSGAQVAAMETDRLAALCVETIATFQQTRGDEIRGFWGGRLFAVILMTHEPAARRSTIKRFSIHLGENGEPFASEKVTLALGPTDRPTLLPFGEFEFLKKQVVNGPGKQFLGGGFKEWQKKAKIAEITPLLALDAAADLIEAASRSADLLRFEGVIGRTVDAVLLGDPPRPQRLRWTSP